LFYWCWSSETAESEHNFNSTFIFAIFVEISKIFHLILSKQSFICCLSYTELFGRDLTYN